MIVNLETETIIDLLWDHLSEQSYVVFSKVLMTPILWKQIDTDVLHFLCQSLWLVAFSQPINCSFVTSFVSIHSFPTTYSTPAYNYMNMKNINVYVYLPF